MKTILFLVGVLALAGCGQSNDAASPAKAGGESKADNPADAKASADVTDSADGGSTADGAGPSTDDDASTADGRRMPPRGFGDACGNGSCPPASAACT